jgi:hypothetical protein
MPEEIQPEDLMDSLNDPVDGPIQVYQDNINVGFT